MRLSYAHNWFKSGLCNFTIKYSPRGTRRRAISDYGLRGAGHRSSSCAYDVPVVHVTLTSPKEAFGLEKLLGPPLVLREPKGET